jgi:hypothetical protein
VPEWKQGCSQGANSFIVDRRHLPGRYFVAFLASEAKPGSARRPSWLLVGNRRAKERKPEEDDDDDSSGDEASALDRLSSDEGTARKGPDHSAATLNPAIVPS